MPDKQVQNLTQLTAVDVTDKIPVSDTSDLSELKYATVADIISKVDVGNIITTSPAKVTPVDADSIPLTDSAASNALKKVTWANIKATLKTYFDSVATTLTNKTISNSTISSGTKLDSTADDNFSYYGMARQAIMNSTFNVSQRGVSTTIPDITITYLHDRWLDFVSRDGGTLPTLTRSLQNITFGDIYEVSAMSRLTMSGTGTSLGANSFGVFEQAIEYGTQFLCGAGKKVTISFWAKSSIAGKRLAVTLRQNYGTGGSALETLLMPVTPITLTSTWTRYSFTFTTNSLVGKTFGTTAAFLDVLIYYQWGATYGNTNIFPGVSAEGYSAGTLDITGVQLNAGDVALPFHQEIYQDDLRRCQRFYETGYLEFIGYGLGGNLVGTGTHFKVEKRANPNVVFTNVFNSNCGATTTRDGTRADYLFGYRTATATGAVNFQDTWTASAELP